MTDEEANKMRDDFISNQSFLLGVVHGSIEAILNTPEETWREKLLALKKTLAQDISKLYYDLGN